MIQKGVKCCISQMARWGLTKLKSKRTKWASKADYLLDVTFGRSCEFKDPCVVWEHPYVRSSLLDSLRRVDPNLILCWELQFYFEHRWHVKWLDQGEEKSILLLQDPPYPIRAGQSRADYVPFDDRALATVRRLMHQLRHGLQISAIEAHVEAQETARKTLESDRCQNADDIDRDFRHVNERLIGKRNVSDPGWERGIGFDPDGKPFADGPGAHTEKVTKAI